MKPAKAECANCCVEGVMGDKCTNCDSYRKITRAVHFTRDDLVKVAAEAMSRMRGFHVQDLFHAYVVVDEMLKDEES